MSKILLSIKPEYVKKILDGVKKYEFRKRLAKDVTKIIIYSSSPEKRIVGEAEVVGTLELPVSGLWEITRKYAGIPRDRFFKYFEDSKNGYAYELGNVVVYEKPKTLEEYGISLAPQSFVYIAEE